MKPWGPWEHSAARTIKAPQVVRKYAREETSDVFHVRYDDVVFDTGDQLADHADASPIWWKGEADYPAWLDLSLPATPDGGEEIVTSFWLDKFVVYAPYEFSFSFTERVGDPNSPHRIWLQNFSLSATFRAGTTDLAQCSILSSTGLTTGVSYGANDSVNNPDCAHSDALAGTFKGNSWRYYTSLTHNPGLTPDSIRFRAIDSPYTGLQQNCTFSFKLLDGISVYVLDHQY